MSKHLVSSLTACNATETTKSLIDTLEMPVGTKRIIGVGCQVKAAGLTTLESISGILELECDNAQSGWGGTQTFPLPMQNALTSGSVALNPYTHVCDIPVKEGYKIKGSITHDMALTITPSYRFWLVVE